MADDRNLFERLDSIEAQNAEIIRLLSSTSDHQQQANVRKPSTQEIMQKFLKQAKKSWMWFGNNAEFKKNKALSIMSFVILLIVGIVTTVVSSICFKLYSTFTLFEDIWLIFGIIYLVYSVRTKRIYEVNELASNSSTKFIKDELGMRLPKREKAVFTIFKVLAIISIVCNIVVIWAGMGKTNQIIATIMEVLFLGAIIFSLVMNNSLFSLYAIIYVEGNNLTTNEKVVLVLPPGAKQLILEEELKTKMPHLYE